jgi:predicted nucleic acid-binding Zn ribbon protein
MKCSKCHSEIPQNAKFCPNCGEKIETTPIIKDVKENKKSNKESMMLFILVLCMIAASIYFIFAEHPSSFQSVALSSASPAATAHSAAPPPPKYTDTEKEAAREKVREILGDQYKRYDEVKKISFYTPWKNGKIPARDGIYWTVTEKDGGLTLHTIIVNFSTDTEWIFWYKLDFSTTEGNWIYTITGSFPEQDSGGKSTEIVMGGKYEELSVPFNELEKGYKLLVNGTNSIIRLEGKNSYFDYHLTQHDIDYLKQGIELDNQLKIIRS